MRGIKRLGCALILPLLLPSLVLAQGLNGLDMDKIQQAAEQMQASANQVQRQRNDVFIFVSLSMPKQSLCDWLQAAADIGAPVLIRGLVHQSFGQTVKAFRGLGCKNPQGLVINPKAFERYQITSVPTVIVRDKNYPNQFDKVSGDGTLRAALREMRENGEQSVLAKQLLMSMKGAMS